MSQFSRFDIDLHDLRFLFRAASRNPSCEQAKTRTQHQQQVCPLRHRCWQHGGKRTAPCRVILRKCAMRIEVGQHRNAGSLHKTPKFFCRA